MAHLKLYETQRVIDKETGDVIIPGSEFQFDKTKMLLVTPRCIVFDDNWDPILLACEFLDNRLNVKNQEWNTVEAKGYALKHLFSFLDAYNLELEDMDVGNVNEFIAWLLRGDGEERYVLGRESKRTGKTINIYLSHLQDFFKYLRFKYNMKDPFFGTKDEISRPLSQPKGMYDHTFTINKVNRSIFKVKERGKKEITILGRTEVETLVNTCSSGRDQIIILLALYSGMRIGEILCLKIGAIGVPDTTAGIQKLPMIPSQTDDKHRRLKTGIRDIYIPSWLMGMMDDYFTKTWLNLVDGRGLSHEYFFVSEGNRNKGMPLSYGAVQSRFDVLFKLTGIDANPHDFRHTYATNLARIGTDISTIAKMLGHKNPETCAIYIKAKEKDEIVKTLAGFYDVFDIGTGEAI